MSNVFSVIEYKGLKGIFVVNEEKKISLSTIPINTAFYDTCGESIEEFKNIIDELGANNAR